MDDLVSKYFREDLTEAEDQALEETLLHSTEDSQRFLGLARTAYERYGLPEPQWPGDPSQWPKPRSGWKAWAGWGIALLGLAAFLSWWWHHRNPAPAALPPSPKPGVTRSELPAGLKPRAGALASKAPRPAAPEQVQGTEGFPGSQGSSWTAVLTPVEVSDEPRKGHSDLEVVIDWPKPGPVTVLVASLDGTPAVLLYQGPLQQGKWAFDWDGRLSDGAMADPGHYEIWVETDAGARKKDIVIRPKPAPQP